LPALPGGPKTCELLAGPPGVPLPVHPARMAQISAASESIDGSMAALPLPTRSFNLSRAAVALADGRRSDGRRVTDQAGQGRV
jgi:hypothetical protein